MTKYVTFLGGNSPVSLPGEQPSQSKSLPTDKQLLSWNNALNHWQPADGAIEIDGVQTAGNDKYYGTNASGTPGFFSLPLTAALNDIGDVNTPAPTNRHVLTWDSGTNKWIDAAKVLDADESTKVTGVDSAGNDKYYGTDEVGGVGFHDLPSGAKGGGTDRIFFENDQTVTVDYTITNNKNAMSAGPITIAGGITVTVGAGESWVVV